MTHDIAQKRRLAICKFDVTAGAAVLTSWRRGGRVLDAGTYLVAPLKVTARPKSSDETITVENLWLFEIADGNFVRAQLYADTAAARNVGK